MARLVCSDPLSSSRARHSNAVMAATRLLRSNRTDREAPYRPDLEVAAVAELLLNGVRSFSPDGSDFVGRHADERLRGRGG